MLGPSFYCLKSPIRPSERSTTQFAIANHCLRLRSSIRVRRGNLEAPSNPLHLLTAPRQAIQERLEWSCRSYQSPLNKHKHGCLFMFYLSSYRIVSAALSLGSSSPMLTSQCSRITCLKNLWGFDVKLKALWLMHGIYMVFLKWFLALSSSDNVHTWISLRHSSHGMTFGCFAS